MAARSSSTARGRGGAGAVEPAGQVPPGGQAQGQALVGGEEAGPVQVAAGERGGLGGAGGFDPLGLEASGDDRIGERVEVDPHAARGHRDQLGRELVGQHHEERALGRLLDGLQQLGPHVGRDEVELVEHQHLPPALGGRAAGAPDDLVGLLGRDGGAHALHDHQVGVLLGGGPGPGRGRRPRRRPPPRFSSASRSPAKARAAARLPDPCGPTNSQACTAWAPAAPAQHGDGSVLAHDVGPGIVGADGRHGAHASCSPGSGNRASTAACTRSWTSPTVPDPSITTQRSGEPAARAA